MNGNHCSNNQCFLQFFIIIIIIQLIICRIHLNITLDFHLKCNSIILKKKNSLTERTVILVIVENFIFLNVAARQIYLFFFLYFVVINMST